MYEHTKRESHFNQHSQRWKDKERHRETVGRKGKSERKEWLKL